MHENWFVRAANTMSVSLVCHKKSVTSVFDVTCCVSGHNDKTNGIPLFNDTLGS